jgi:hypothetical protein
MMRRRVIKDGVWFGPCEYVKDYQETTPIPLRAVDAVIDFMGEDPGWGERPLWEGHVIYSSKAPRDPKGYASAH